MEPLVLFLGTICNILKWFLWPILWWKKQEKKVLPPMNEPILFLSATTLADRIRKRLVSFKLL